MLRTLAAFIEALRRSIFYIISLGREQKTIRQSLTKWLKIHFWEVLLVAFLALIIFGKQYFYSLFAAIGALITTGPDAFLIFRFLKVFRIFSTPIDELFIGTIATAGFVAILVYRGWNYFWSQFEHLKNDE